MIQKYRGHEKRMQDFNRKPEGRGHIRDLVVDGRMVLKWILKEWLVRDWVRFIWLRYGPVEGSYKHGNEPSGLQNWLVIY